MNKRAVGTDYEKRVGAYLKEHGYQILEYNFRCRCGEIDIIAKEGKYLVFVEVKYRRTEGTGNPLEAVDRRKQKTISNVAMFYLASHGLGEETPCRFDVASVLGGDINLIKNAFEYCGNYY